MREVKINKLVVNIGTGSEEPKLVNARRLIETLTKRKPMDQLAKHRLPAFKIAQGQKIGAYVTVRGSDAMELAKRLFDAVGNKIDSRKVTDNSVSFGIKEYIDISGVKYDPKIGMLGMNVNLSFMEERIEGCAEEEKGCGGAGIPQEDIAGGDSRIPEEEFGCRGCELMMVRLEERRKGKGTRKCRICGGSRALIRAHGLLRLQEVLPRGGPGAGLQAIRLIDG